MRAPNPRTLIRKTPLHQRVHHANTLRIREPAGFHLPLEAGPGRVGYPYLVDLARPLQRKCSALALAMLARRTCPKCRLDVGHCIPRTHGICGMCLAAEDQCAAG